MRHFNGVEALTGEYLPAPDTAEDFVRRIRDEPLSSAELRHTRWWLQRLVIDDKHRRPAKVVDPLNLASAGWGVIFAPGIGAEVELKLKPLLDRRSAQAGVHYRTYRYSLDPNSSGETKDEFLRANKAQAGAANPRDGGVPYYLLIVGSPAQISFRFQYELDVVYAVGRIHFENVEDYAAYARNVVEVEEAVERGEALRPARQLALFGACRQSDMATERAAEELLAVLAKRLRSEIPKLPLRLLIGEQGKKEQLKSLLGGTETPSLLLTSSHGMAYPCGHADQRLRQGALLCQDWPGKGEVTAEHCFAGADLGDSADLRGLIAFHFACYSGGTPERSSFDVSDTGMPDRLAPTPFLSHLSQRLLGHPRGALAVVAHIDRAWSTSFSWYDKGQPQIFEDTFVSLLEGEPLGYAMEPFNVRHGELSVGYTELVQARDRMEPFDPQALERAFRGNNDVRNFVVLGDPAVRSVLQVERPKR